MLAGSQSGKTSWGPWWLAREIEQRGAGDYIAATASFDLFKLKMLPAMREVFENILGIARYWAGDRVLELRDPQTGEFRARRANDAMWGRIILRSAESPSGLESATAKGGWLDEAGQDGFELDAWRAIRRRLALHRGRILITTTLYNLGWLKQQVIDPAMEGGVTAIETLPNGAEIELVDNAKADIALIQFDSIANPLFPADEYDHARDTMPDDEFQMFYRGRVAKLRTLIYDIFDRRLHTCPRFEIPKEWRRYLGLDFGGVNTAGVFFAEEPGTSRWYGYREYLAGGKTAAAHAADLKAGEPMVPVTVGGSKSEGQWRDEFRAGGLPVREPDVSEVDVGISRVYGALKAGELVFFDDLHGTLDQLGRYRRKRDKSGEVTQEIENKNAFHFCFVAGTPIMTLAGNKPIEEVGIVDLLWTRYGWQPVISTGCRHEQPLMRLVVSDSRELVGTPDHPVWVVGSGFVPIGNLQCGAPLFSLGGGKAWNEKLSPSTVSPTIVIPARRGHRIGAISSAEESISIGKSGRLATAPFRPATTSTTKTEIPLTTLSAISNLWQQVSMNECITWGRPALRNEPILTASGHWLLNGMEAPKAKNGIGGMARESLKTVPTRLLSASNAGQHTRLRNLAAIVSVRRHAEQAPDETAESTTSHAPAPSAALSSAPIVIPAASIVRPSVVKVENAGFGTVYNLTVAVAHEYFANGVLVSNCDAIRYIVSWGKRKKRTPKVGWL